MNCPHCQSAIAADARFCPVCGAPVVTAQQYPQPPFPSTQFGRVGRHLRSLSQAWYVYAALRGILGFFALIFAHHFVNHWMWSSGNDDFIARHFIGAALIPMGLLSLAISVGLDLLVAWGLQQRQPWARILGIVMGILVLFHFPLGTVLGIYTLWVLAPRVCGAEYDAQAVVS